MACAAVYAAMSDAPVSNLDLIHSRLMGVAKSTLMKMISKRLMADLPTLNTVRQADCFCEHCIAAKMCKLKYDKKSKRTATEPLELVHFDVFGDIKPHGLRGERYVLVIVDDYTRMVWAIPMNKKSEMIEQQVTFGNDSDSDDESEAGLDVSDTSDTSADKRVKGL